LKQDPFEMDGRTTLGTIKFLKKNLDPKNPESKIHFFGVEPLVSFPLLRQFVRLTERFGWKYGITTNAVGLNPTTIDWLLNHKFFILTSYDGEWHDRYRVLPNGEGSSDVVEKNLLNLAARDYKLHIAMSMVPGEEKNFFPSIVMTYYKFNPLMIAMNKIVDNYSGSYDLDELKRQFVLLARWYKSIGGAGKRPPFWLQFIRKTLETKWPRSKRQRFTCGAGHGSISVDCDGQVFPCYRLFQFPEYRIGDVWNGIDEAKLAEWRSLDNQKCHGCDVMPCSTCYGENLDATRSLTTPNPETCKFQRALMEACMEVFDWKPS
jgi:uncharacterized protein